jgi:pimeloyl-ACP methyl ester carboxylesterase
MRAFVDGLRVHYYDRGSGPAVLFLHGWGADFSLFAPFLDRAADGGRRACALDLPGFGQSAEPTEGWGLDDYADFVLRFLGKLEIGSAVLVGHSFGGSVAVKIAVRESAARPGIPKLVLVNGAGIRRKKTLRQRAGLLAYKTARRVLSLGPLRKRFAGFLESWRNRRASEDYRNASPRMRECLVKTVSEDLTPLLPSIPCPTLLVWGENDTATPVTDARLMESLIPGAGLVVLQNAGHYSFLDQPYVFGRVLDSFLELPR